MQQPAHIREPAMRRLSRDGRSLPCLDESTRIEELGAAASIGDARHDPERDRRNTKASGDCCLPDAATLQLLFARGCEVLILEDDFEEQVAKEVALLIDDRLITRHAVLRARGFGE